MNTEPLTQAEKKELRGVAQRLKPHVNVGKNGLTPTVLSEIDTALTKNGLIKIRFEAERATMVGYYQEIVSQTGAELIGKVGRTASFFREMPEDETLD